MMNIINLIYINPHFKTMINFEVEIGLSYEQSYEQHSATRYIPELLKRARPTIQAFGNAITLPNELAMHMSDPELDYFLMLLHKDVDALIDGHIYVRLPSKHAKSLSRVSNATSVWRVNGVGLNGVVMAGKDKGGHVLVATPTFQELANEFIEYK